MGPLPTIRNLRPERGQRERASIQAGRRAGGHAGRDPPVRGPSGTRPLRAECGSPRPPRGADSSEGSVSALGANRPCTRRRPGQARPQAPGRCAGSALGPSQTSLPRGPVLVASRSTLSDGLSISRRHVWAVPFITGRPTQPEGPAHRSHTDATLSSQSRDRRAVSAFAAVERRGLPADETSGRATGHHSERKMLQPAHLLRVRTLFLDTSDR